MMNIDITPIIQAIIALLAAIITFRLIPWIKASTTETQQTNIRTAVKVLVFAAEQLYGAGKGKEKLKYVQDRLAKQNILVDVDEIEAAVAEYLNYGVDIDAENEVTIDDEYDLPPLEDWPLEMIVAFCNDNGIPCGWCHTREEYIEAIVRGAKETEETGERIATSAPEEPPRNDNGETDGGRIATSATPPPFCYYYDSRFSSQCTATGEEETEEAGERIATSAPEEPPRNDGAGETARTFSLDQVIENDAEEPENRQEAEG